MRRRSGSLRLPALREDIGVAARHNNVHGHAGELGYDFDSALNGAVRPTIRESICCVARPVPRAALLFPKAQLGSR